MRYYGEDIRLNIGRSLSSLQNSSGLDTTYGIGQDTFVKGARVGVKSALLNLRFNIKCRNDSMLSRFGNLMTVLSEMYSSTDRTLEEVLVKIADVNQKISLVNDSLDNVYEALSTVRANKGYLNKTEIYALVEACNETRDMFLRGFRQKVMTTGTDKESLKEYEKEFDLLGLASESDETKSELLNIIVKISGLGLDPETEDEMANRVFDESIVKAVRSGDKTEIDKALKDKFASEIKKNLIENFNSDYADGFFENFINNCSMEALFRFTPAFFDTVKTFEGMDTEEQVDFMVRFALAGEGYSCEPDSKLNFISDYFGKNGSDWCALHSLFCMKFSGYLNLGTENMVIPNFDDDVENHEWASVKKIAENFPSDKRHLYYTGVDDTTYNIDEKPCVGDYLLCHCWQRGQDGEGIGHIALVIGVDGEKIYTIEGNRDNGIHYAVYDLNDEKGRNEYWDVVGFLDMGGTKQDRSYLPDDIDQRAYVENYASLFQHN